MPKHNPANERVKHAYFQYLREARRRNHASIDGVAAALTRFEESTGHRAFANFHREQAVSFKRKLDRQLSARSGERLRRATVHSTLSALRAFFIWLVDQPGFRRKISYTDADYFNLSEGDVRIAKAAREKPFPSVDQVHHVLSLAPASTDLELRDRALIALALLTGARDGALASLRLKHVHLDQGRVDQDARDVKTKFSKTFSTWFFPVGGEALAIFTDWVDHLRTTLHWGDADPLFPATRMDLGPNGGFVAAGLKREHWSTAEPIRRIFRQAFERADLPYFKPHAIRDTLVQLGQRVCTTAEEFKAWSQNLGHEKVLTTFTSYGAVPSHRQAALIRGMVAGRAAGDGATVEARLAKLERLEAAMAVG
ncbi:MAG: tyrosine-type recombinase/integrase [Pseudomonadota bacterium]|nr:tyrosine-type recombinase/integrase [Pseudomonadota bacterium]